MRTGTASTSARRNSSQAVPRSRRRRTRKRSLSNEPRFAPLPVITLGMSMGSTMAWWAAALEPRVAACVDLCCLAEFDALVATEADDLHGEYFFVPGLRREFSAAAINALIAPRPHLSCVGAADPLTPAAGVASIDHALRAAYAESGVPHAWQQRTGRDLGEGRGVTDPVSGEVVLDRRPS